MKTKGNNIFFKLQLCFVDKTTQQQLEMKKKMDLILDKIYVSTLIL